MSDISARYRFYVPFAYYYKVRLKTVAKALSWGLIYLFVTFYFSWLSCGAVDVRFVGSYVCLLVGVFGLYELGYMDNDTFATRREEQPTLRLTGEEQTYFYEHWRGIFLIRLLIVAVGLGLFVWLQGWSRESMWTCVAVGLVPLIFFAYNRFRGKYNVLLYPVLVFSRYLPFLLPYRPSWVLVGLLFVCFPLVNWLERFSMPKYRFAFMRWLLPREESKTWFRVGYYAVCVTGLLLWGAPWEWVVPFGVLLVYRLALAVMVRWYVPRRYLRG